MCRSIRQLRRGDDAGAATTGEAEAAALQYVRKISGFRAPSARNDARVPARRRGDRRTPPSACSRRSARRVAEGPDPFADPVTRARDPRRPRGAVAAFLGRTARTPAARDRRRRARSRRRADLVAPPGPRRRRRPPHASTAPTSRRSSASTARRCSSTTWRGPPRTSARSRARSTRAGVRHVVRFALKACPDPRILRRAPRPGRARRAGQRRHRRLLAGRGAPRARERLAARTRSATPGRTCPSATSTSCSRTRSGSTSTP